MTERKCKNCTFYKENHFLPKKGATSRGNCCFNPPAQLPQNSSQISFGWRPVVEENDFCSKFESKTG